MKGLYLAGGSDVLFQREAEFPEDAMRREDDRRLEPANDLADVQVRPITVADRMPGAKTPLGATMLVCRVFGEVWFRALVRLPTPPKGPRDIEPFLRAYRSREPNLQRLVAAFAKSDPIAIAVACGIMDRVIESPAKAVAVFDQVRASTR